jgi:hypothetical protein
VGGWAVNPSSRPEDLPGCDFAVSPSVSIDQADLAERASQVKIIAAPPGWSAGLAVTRPGPKNRPGTAAGARQWQRLAPYLHALYLDLSK